MFISQTLSLTTLEKVLVAEQTALTLSEMTTSLEEALEKLHVARQTALGMYGNTEKGHGRMVLDLVNSLLAEKTHAYPLLQEEALSANLALQEALEEAGQESPIELAVLEAKLFEAAPLQPASSGEDLYKIILPSGGTIAPKKKGNSFPMREVFFEEGQLFRMIPITAGPHKGFIELEAVGGVSSGKLLDRNSHANQGSGRPPILYKRLPNRKNNDHQRWKLVDGFLVSAVHIANCENGIQATLVKSV